jgi:hypothetical protein
MDTATTTTAISLDHLLDVLLPDGYLKLTAEVAGDEHAWWFRKLEGQWIEQAVERPRPGFHDLLTRHRYPRVRFSPCGWRTMFTHGPSFIVPIACLWASIALVRTPVSLAGGVDTMSGAFRIDPASEMRAQAIVDGCPPRSVLLDETDRLTVIWRLEEPISPDEASRVLPAIALKLGLARGGAPGS